MRGVQEAAAAGEASRIGAAHAMLRRLIEPTAKAFETLILDGKATGGSRHEALRWVELAGADVAAYLTAKAALDLHGQKAALVANRAAEYLADEVRYRLFRGLDERRFNVVMGKFKTRSKLHKRRVLNEMSKRAGVDIVEDVRADPARRLRIGTKLLDVLAQSTGLFEIRHVKSGAGFRGQARNTAFWHLQAPHLGWLDRRNELLQFLDPVYRPMVERPIEWAPGTRGGYRYGLKDALPLIRGAGVETLERLQNATTMPQVFDALNAVQRTAWVINPHILGYYQALERGASQVGFYEHEMADLPKPLDIDTNEESRTVWRKAQGRLKTENHLRQLRRQYFGRLLNDAEGLAQRPFWFVYNLDFRGRVYPITTYLSPQGSDESKALLRFHEAKPLGAFGESYLALHGANMLGQVPMGPKVSTLTLEERCAWVRQHTPEIRQAACDPFGVTWWRTADEPLQFLAFCCEWNTLEEWIDAGHAPEDFVSGLPAAQDGSCNGIQHFAAMMRDPITGFTVNLVPSARPNDLYQTVTDAVLVLLEAQRGVHPWAAVWLDSGLVTRKFCKRPTMTYGYGSRRYGFAEQLREYVRKHERWLEVHKQFLVNGQGLTIGCQYISGLIWDTLQEKARAAAVAMDWMRLSVRAVVKNNAPVRWTVPGTGFMVEQAYRKNRSRQINTVLNGRLFQPRVIEPDSLKLDPHKQQNAIAPNVVHSLDAACLMRTVLAAQAAGTTSFGMVHDSYATVPGDASVLATATRQVFVAYYETYDVMEMLYQHWLTLSGEALDLFPPPPPPQGSLDLRGVLESDFFFS